MIANPQPALNSRCRSAVHAPSRVAVTVLPRSRSCASCAAVAAAAPAAAYVAVNRYRVVKPDVVPLFEADIAARAAEAAKQARRPCAESAAGRGVTCPAPLPARFCGSRGEGGAQRRGRGRV
jgi:hypothetical protein